jgi:hypothetical protein
MGATRQDVSPGVRRTVDARRCFGVRDPVSGADPIAPEDVRRWLGRLGSPDKLGRERQLLELLQRFGRLTDSEGSTAAGRVAAEFLRAAIERLRPANPASRQETLPYEVVRVCFVEDVPLLAAADRLGMSGRQLTRERSRAITMLIEEIAALGESGAAPLSAAAGGPSSVAVGEPARNVPGLPEYRFEPIPAIVGFLPRPRLTRVINDSLTARRVVHVHGPAGGGKTSVIAELALEWSSRQPVLWYRLRAGLNDSLPALLFEIGQHLNQHGRPRLAQTTAAALTSMDVSLVSRVAVHELSGHEATFVLDDYHVASGRPGIAPFLDDLTARLPGIGVVTVGRNDQPGLRASVPIEVPPLTVAETRALLRQLGDRLADQHVELVHHWTRGVPFLVQLAASWLETAAPEEVEAGGYDFSEQDEVRVFLLDALTGLMDTSDRAILEAASVFRDRFTDPALAYVANRTIGQVVDTSRGLVGTHLASRSRQGGIALLCEVLREYVYQRLAPELRAELHGRAADWYRGHSQPEEAAHHAALADTSQA